MDTDAMAAQVCDFAATVTGWAEDNAVSADTDATRIRAYLHMNQAITSLHLAVSYLLEDEREHGLARERDALVERIYTAVAGNGDPIYTANAGNGA